MDTRSPRFWPIFFEVYEALPRQGPGNRACAARALALCPGLPEAPRILDLGCGVGGQTLHLAVLTAGNIVAVDSHKPSIERLRQTAAERGLGERIQPMLGDMAETGLPPGSFDLVWSEGALYNLGLERALRVCRELLRPGGFLCFTDAVWRTDHPPLEVKAAFESEYPTMGRTEDVVAQIARCGFSLLGHFTLPDEAWWEDFYTPMEARIAVLRQVYREDAEALAILDVLAQEPEMHRENTRFYAYEFFSTRRKDA